jgi:hypothetical protein
MHMNIGSQFFSGRTNENRYLQLALIDLSTTITHPWQEQTVGRNTGQKAYQRPIQISFRNDSVIKGGKGQTSKLRNTHSQRGSSAAFVISYNPREHRQGYPISVPANSIV